MRSKWFLIASAGLIVALLAAGAFGVTSALAQEPPPTGGDAPGRGLFRGGGRGGFGMGLWARGPQIDRDWTAFDVAADALGLTPEELFSELHSGKTLEEIADAQGVDVEAVQDALEAARAESVRESVSAAVESGELSQDEADWLREGLDRGYWPRARGTGRARGWCHFGR